jgi:hypothetical protein
MEHQQHCRHVKLRYKIQREIGFLSRNSEPNNISQQRFGKPKHSLSLHADGSADDKFDVRNLSFGNLALFITNASEFVQRVRNAAASSNWRIEHSRFNTSSAQPMMVT